MDTALDAIFDFGNNVKEKQTFYLLEHFDRAMLDMELGEYQSWEYPFVANGTTVMIPTHIRRNVIPLIKQGVVQVCTEHQRGADGNKEVATERGLKLFPVFDPAEGAQYPEWEYRIWSGAFA